MTTMLARPSAVLRLSGPLVAFAVCFAGLPHNALAAPPGDLPFGAYDPEGDFTSDSEVSIEHIFMPWEDVDLNTLAEADAYALARKRALMITIEPWTWTRDERNTPDFLLSGIQQGYYDANMRSICMVIDTLQSPVTVRWGHEMENPNGHFIWAVWRPKDYIAAFQRMIDVCREAAPRINVVWSPMGLEAASDYYPGDDYVDLVGLSIFGLEAWDKAKVGRATTYREMLDKHYAEVAGFNKPVLVAEVGYSGSADYVATWESQVREARPDLPLLVGAAYFDQKEVYPWPDGFGLPDWRLAHRIIE